MKSDRRYRRKRWPAQPEMIWVFYTYGERQSCFLGDDGV
jgi:hypothetical protein